jgi:hypothetical protein
MNLTDDHQVLVPVIRRSEYTLSLEQANADTTFVHCTTHVPWTGRVRKQLTGDVTTLLTLHGGPLHAIIRPDDLKLQRFARIMNAEHVATLTDLTTGQTDLIYRSRDTHDG